MCALEYMIAPLGRLHSEGLPMLLVRDSVASKCLVELVLIRYFGVRPPEEMRRLALGIVAIFSQLLLQLVLSLVIDIFKILLCLLSNPHKEIAKSFISLKSVEVNSVPLFSILKIFEEIHMR